MKSLFLAIFLLTLCACNNDQQQSKPAIKSENKEKTISPYFGFLNEQKDSLIALPMDQAMEGPEQYNYVIVESQISPLEFVQNKIDNKESTGRQTAQNFANSEGSLFKIKEIVKSGEFGIKEQLEKKYNRKINKSTTLAVLNDHAEFNLTVFENQQDSALAVFSYAKDEQLVNLDFPAVYDDISTWRVDDGGQFDNEAFQILTVLRSEEGISFISIFWGAEGYELNFYQPKKSQFISAAQAYGYSSPL